MTRRRLGLLLAALVTPALAACGSKATSSPLPPGSSGGADAGDVQGEDAAAIPGEDAGFPTYTWWQDVQPIVAVKCQLCHADPAQFGAPRPLVQYRHTQVRTARGVPVHVEMAQRIFAAQSPMPPPSQPRLTEEEKEIIRVWSAIGAPEGTPPPDGGVAEDAGAPADDAGTLPADGGTIGVDSGDIEPADGGTPAMTRAVEIRATNADRTGPYDLPVQNTNYVCWSLTVPQGPAGEEYAVRFEHIVDNTTNLHHMLLFRNRNNDADPGPFDCGSFPLSWDMISGWAPGRMAEVMPPGVGVPIRAGDQLILQAHYDRVSSRNVTDGSGIRVILTSQAGLQQAGILWSGAVWLSPINGSSVTKSGTCRVRHPMTIFADFPHMHELGLSIKLEVQRQGAGPWTTVVDIPAWDFEDQPNVPIPPTEQQLAVGDRLRTTCTWDTRGRSVSFGESTSDEMCFNFIYHYPLVPTQPNLYCVTAVP